MKTFSLVLLLALTGCNSVTYYHTHGTNEVVRITYRRVFWQTGSLDGGYTNGPLKASIKVGSSRVDAQAIEAFVKGIVEGAVKGAK